MNVYECAIVLETSSSDAQKDKIRKSVEEVVKSHNGEVLISDEWGTLNFAQQTKNGTNRGIYLYFIYESTADTNVELDRRFSIDESVLKRMFLKLGESEAKEQLLKEYRTPYSGDAARRPNQDQTKSDLSKDRRLFARRRTCWFTANKVEPSWKDPSTFNWLVNEFGKISPSRITGLSFKYQRAATTAIKRARCIGIASYVNNRVAEAPRSAQPAQ